MIRIAKESDLSAVAAVYEAILDHEDATGLHYTGWKRGAYPTADTARNIFNAGTLYVGVDEDGAIWGSVLFGALMILYLRLVIAFIPTQLYKILPYVVTVIVLIISSMRNNKEKQPPASLGLNYFREER